MASTFLVGISISCANRFGATGSIDTIRMASMARLMSSPSPFITSSTTGSALVHVDQVDLGPVGTGQPTHVDIAEQIHLVDLD